MSPVLIGVSAVSFGALAFGSYKAPRLMSVIIWALIATIFFCAGLVLRLPGVFSENALLMTVAVPLIWALFQFWCYWDHNKWRVLFGLFAISIIGAVVVLTTDPIVA